MNWKDTKLSVKISGGFITVLALLTMVAFMGYQGMDRITKTINSKPIRNTERG